MKRAAILIAVLGISVWSLGQSGEKAAGQGTQASQAGDSAQGKRPPRAKTQPEYAAYNAAVALTDPAAAEKAADDFATKFPDSELRVLVYRFAMHAYQQANNADKMLEMARKALTYDPDDPEALLGVAQALSERTRDTDLDKDDRLAEAKKDAQRALATIDTDVPTVGQPADRIAQLKGFLRSEAYEVLGTLSFNAKAWKDAELDLRKSIEAFPQQPDPIAIYRLAVALDEQEKLQEAMKYCQQAVDMTKEDTELGKAARAEKDRLEKSLGINTAPPAENQAPPK